MANFSHFEADVPSECIFPISREIWDIPTTDCNDLWCWYQIHDGCKTYLGKTTNTAGLPLGEFFMKELVIHGSNRNVIMDNWFTFIPLAKLTILGTMRSFCFDKELTLLSYKLKASKIILYIYVLSSSGEEGNVNSKTNEPTF